jgi:hypothetical protein
MRNTTLSVACPKCGKAIPAAASQGLCPACALAAVANPTEAGPVTEERTPPPSLEAVSQADEARELDLSEGAVKVAVHRLRKRFRELVKAEIAQTVDSPAQIQEELRYLVEVLARA